MDQRRLLRALVDVFRYIDGDHTLWEREPLQRLTIDGQLSAYMHTGFWQPMDTLRHKQVLEELLGQWLPALKIWK